jgi:hypothetical protein
MFNLLTPCLIGFPFQTRIFWGLSPPIVLIQLCYMSANVPRLGTQILSMGVHMLIQLQISKPVSVVEVEISVWLAVKLARPLPRFFDIGCWVSGMCSGAHLHHPSFFSCFWKLLSVHHIFFFVLNNVHHLNTFSRYIVKVGAKSRSQSENGNWLSVYSIR